MSGKNVGLPLVSRNGDRVAGQGRFRVTRAASKAAGAVLALLMCSSPSLADGFDLSFANGLTVKLVGSSGITVPGFDQGFSMIAFNEAIGTPWWNACLNQRFYVNVNSSGGKSVYQTVLLAQAMGKKISRILGNTANPNVFNVCELNYVEVQM